MLLVSAGKTSQTKQLAESWILMNRYVFEAWHLQCTWCQWPPSATIWMTDRTYLRSRRAYEMRTIIPGLTRFCLTIKMIKQKEWADEGKMGSECRVNAQGEAGADAMWLARLFASTILALSSIYLPLLTRPKELSMLYFTLKVFESCNIWRRWSILQYNSWCLSSHFRWPTCQPRIVGPIS